MQNRTQRMMIEMLTFIWTWWGNKNYGPSIGDISIGLGWSKARAQRLTDEAESRGLIVSDSKVARSIRPVGIEVTLPPLPETIGD